jgi:hypothetical protein
MALQRYREDCRWPREDDGGSFGETSHLALDKGGTVGAQLHTFIPVCTTKLSAETRADDRLCGRWPLYPNTLHQARTAPGDRLFVYLGGHSPRAVFLSSRLDRGQREHSAPHVAAS